MLAPVTIAILCIYAAGFIGALVVLVKSIREPEPDWVEWARQPAQDGQDEDPS